MSYYRPFYQTQQVSYSQKPSYPQQPSYSYYSRYSNPLPPHYIQESPEYPSPPLYFDHSLPLPPRQYMIPQQVPLERPIKTPLEPRYIPQTLQKETPDIEPTHGNFFKDPTRVLKTDFEIIINAMKEQIILLRDIEKLKEKLAYTADFHIDHIYNKFDDNHSNAITLKEFRQGLVNLGVGATEKETYLIIRQHSQNDRLVPAEFESLFLPKSGFMKHKLLQKDKNPEFIFKQETLELCKELLGIHLRLETSWEKLKQKMQLRRTNLRNLFKFIDIDQNNSVEAADMKQMLEKHSMFPLSEEVEFVFQRFDEKKKKVVGIDDFVRELTTTASPPVIPELEKFINVIKKQVELEKVIEQKKADLLKMKEFDFEKVYKIFDDNESGAISFQEFKRGVVEAFDVKAQDEDLMMLFQTFNSNDDGKLVKLEFKKMIYPSDMQLYNKLVFQPGALTKKNEGNYKFIITKILEFMIEAEKQWRNAKKSFEKKEETLKLLFKQMDYDKDELLKENDFRNFLQESGFVASSSEIFAVIRRFDRNGDCNIDLEEFLSELGKGQKIKKIELDFSDELISLFKGVREFFGNIEKARQALLKRYDFNVNDVLELFDADKTGQVSINELKRGFSLFGVEIQDKECYFVCRRYSEGRNYFLNYDEFADLFNPHSNIRKKIELPGRKYLSNYMKDKIISHDTKLLLNKLFLMLCNFEVFWNGIKTTMQQKNFDVVQAFKNLDLKRDTLIDAGDIDEFYKKNELPLIDKTETQFILFLFEPRNTGQVTLENFKAELSPIEKFEEVAKKVSILEDISEILREFIKVCREIEGYKQTINQKDFNMKELFELLDANGGGVLTKDELLSGLKRLHCEVSDAECRILMREYCQDNDLEVMNFESFRQMFTPLNVVSNMETQSSLRSSRVSLAINKEDLKNIAAFFKNVIASEKKAEKFRQSLVTKKVDLMKIFKVLDSQNDGFLSGEDFIKFIIKSDVSSNKNDINLLVSRFDKDKSGTISREEFVMELLPTPASYGDKGDDGELLKGLFTEQLIRLKVLEQRKIELLKKKNFRICDLFNVLDENGSGILSNVEFRTGLYAIFDIKITSWEEVNLLIFKYSRRKDDLMMELEDFKRFFIPISGDYKNSEAFAKPMGKRRDVDESLINLTGKFFTYLIRYESFMRVTRGIINQKNLNLSKWFALLNTKRSQQITWENFKEFAVKYEIASSEEEIKMIFSVYDINGNGKISEQEFISELKPRDLSTLFQKKQENFDYLKIILLELKRNMLDVENMRKLLFKQPDFKIINLYKMFDLDESYQISKSEMLRFFKKHGIFTNEALVELLLKRYSIDNNMLMNWGEFCIMLMPVVKDKNVEKVMDSSRYGYTFQKETWTIIKGLFRVLSEAEREIEILRKHIKLHNIHLEGVFRILDRNDKGSVTNQYFAEFILKNKIFTYPLDVKCVIKRLDKRDTGSISQKAFLEEFRPTEF